MNVENPDVENPNRVHPAQAPGLIVDALQHFSRLVQGEVALAKQEVSENISRAVVGLAMIGVAALLALTGLNVLAAAAVTALTAAGLPGWAATLIVAGVVIAIAAILVSVGIKRIKPSNMTPDRAMGQVRKDIRTIKEKANV